MAVKTNPLPALRRKKLTPVEEKWASYESALIVTAHPDDAEFLAGGTIAKLCDLGLSVTLCIATSGDKGTRDASLRPQELAAIREAEQRAAAKVLGVERCIFWGFPDGFLEESHELRGQIVRLIRELRPDLMITWDGHRPGFNHTDHRVIGRAVRDALYPAAHDPLYYPEHAADGLGPHRSAELLLAGAQDPDFHVDISAYLERKVDAVLCHTSQIGGRTRDELLKRYRGDAKSRRETRRRTGHDFAESFQRVEFRRPPGAPGTPPPAGARADSPRHEMGTPLAASQRVGRG